MLSPRCHAHKPGRAAHANAGRGLPKEYPPRSEAKNCCLYAADLVAVVIWLVWPRNVETEVLGLWLGEFGQPDTECV